MALRELFDKVAQGVEKEERCSAEAERSDTDGSFNAFVTLLVTLGSYP